MSAVLDLGTITQLRGRHSTGLVGVYRDKGRIHSEFYKDVGTSSEVLFSDPVKKILSKRPHIIAGHCRHATKGSIIPKNAHPFKVEHIVGMHNGTLYGDKEHGDKTDSQIFFEKLAERGLQEALDDTTGAYAFVWIDHKRGTLNLLRNEARTLYVMHGGGTTYWSSEFGMLSLIRSRGMLQCDTPEAIGAHQHVEISLRSPKDVSVKAVEPKKQKWTFSQPRQDPPFKIEDKKTVINTVDKNNKPIKLEHVVLGPTAPVKKETREGPPVGFSSEALARVKYSGYKMRTMDGNKAREILEEGCASCDRPAKILNTVYFFQDRSFLCGHCVELPDRVEYVGAKINDIWPSHCALNKQEKENSVQSK